METQTVTYYVQLKVQYDEGLGYKSYVFENLNYQDYDYQFITAVRFPNWESPPIKDGEIGYVVLRYVREGIDQWYNGEELVFFNDTNIIFMKFIPEKPAVDMTEIILD